MYISTGRFNKGKKWKHYDIDNSIETENKNFTQT